MVSIFKAQKYSTIVLMLAVVFSWTGAFAQQIRLKPIRSAPLGSPVGTVGEPVTPEYNINLHCWEYRVSAGGFEVDIEVQANAWGFAAGSPTLGAIQATILPSSYTNGQGGDLVPKGWPGSPLDGAYQPRMRCDAGGDLRSCSPPFDPTCDNGNNGICTSASNWVMPACANEIPVIGTSTLDYHWATAAQIDCNVDDGSHKTVGGLILEVPSDASGTYVIELDADQSFMWTYSGLTFPYINITHACITLDTGSCCSNIGPHMNCEDNLTSQQCDLRPGPRLWVEGDTCNGPVCIDDCDFHGGDLACDDGNPCTVDTCTSHCGYRPSYDVATQCCDPSTGNTTPLEDGDLCTVGTCDPTTGDVTQGPNPNCVIHDPDVHPKNRYVSFETGAITMDRAFQVRMTGSWHFPQSSSGDLGWVGVPDGNGTALVVPDPVFLPSWPDTVRVGDCEIAPGSWYEVRATEDGVSFDPPIGVQTTPAPGARYWGDIVGGFNGVAWGPPNGVLNIIDVQAAIKTFQADPTAPPLTWSDVEPEVPNRVVNLNDALRLILAFKGEPYPFTDPADCP